jgi:hypothetical protein
MRKTITLSLLCCCLFGLYSCTEKEVFTIAENDLFREAESNSILVTEGYVRCTRFVDAWLNLADPVTGLIPRNINDEKSKDIWNAKDCAADNYPFMVLSSALLDRELFEGTMSTMLSTETKLTSRIGAMPDTWSFSKQAFAVPDTVLPEIIFGSAEYIKDGLIPLTEWLGPSRWSERMISILDDIWKFAPLDTPYGKIPSDNPEVNGDMLQALSRIFWFTGDRKYLDWAQRLGDYYLLGKNHPTKDFSVLRLRDHGCEIVSGLCELYATVSHANKEKKSEYMEPVHQMLDRILETGRNEDGLFYNSIDPVKGIPVDSKIADNFGYTLNGFYTVYLIDGIERYREAVVKALQILDSKYRNYTWEGTSQDGYADAIEGALNLYVREPVSEAKEWIDSEIRVLWSKQQESGIIEGWHGDGNFARTTIMYCLWKSGGAYLLPWEPEVSVGGVYNNGSLLISLKAEKNWKGKLMFDIRRHDEFMNLPFDWPRINQFPEYFVADRTKNYKVLTGNGKELNISGSELRKGLDLNMKKGQTRLLLIRPL